MLLKFAKQVIAILQREREKETVHVSMHKCFVEMIEQPTDHIDLWRSSDFACYAEIIFIFQLFYLSPKVAMEKKHKLGDLKEHSL